MAPYNVLARSLRSRVSLDVLAKSLRSFASLNVLANSLRSFASLNVLARSLRYRASLNVLARSASIAQYARSLREPRLIPLTHAHRSWHYGCEGNLVPLSTRALFLSTHTSCVNRIRKKADEEELHCS